MASLKDSKCVPCQGNIPPLSLDEANRKLAEIPLWELTDEGTKLIRTFKFKNFKEALTFVEAVSIIAETEQHHPDISFGWGYCKIVLFTHKIKGLHENDFIMAAKINAVGLTA